MPKIWSVVFPVKFKRKCTLIRRIVNNICRSSSRIIQDNSEKLSILFLRGDSVSMTAVWTTLTARRWNKHQTVDFVFSQQCCTSITLQTPLSSQCGDSSFNSLRFTATNTRSYVTVWRRPSRPNSLGTTDTICSAQSFHTPKPVLPILTCCSMSSSPLVFCFLGANALRVT